MGTPNRYNDEQSRWLLRGSQTPVAPSALPMPDLPPIGSGGNFTSNYGGNPTVQVPTAGGTHLNLGGSPWGNLSQSNQPWSTGRTQAGPTNVYGYPSTYGGGSATAQLGEHWLGGGNIGTDRYHNDAPIYNPSGYIPNTNSGDASMAYLTPEQINAGSRVIGGAVGIGSALGGAGPGGMILSKIAGAGSRWLGNTFLGEGGVFDRHHGLPKGDPDYNNPDYIGLDRSAYGQPYDGVAAPQGPSGQTDMQRNMAPIGNSAPTQLSYGQRSFGGVTPTGYRGDSGRDSAASLKAYLLGGGDPGQPNLAQPDDFGEYGPTRYNAPSGNWVSPSQGQAPALRAGDVNSVNAYNAAVAALNPGRTGTPGPSPAAQARYDSDRFDQYGTDTGDPNSLSGDVITRQDTKPGAPALPDANTNTAWPYNSPYLSGPSKFDSPRFDIYGNDTGDPIGQQPQMGTGGPLMNQPQYPLQPGRQDSPRFPQDNQGIARALTQAQLMAKLGWR